MDWLKSLVYGVPIVTAPLDLSSPPLMEFQLPLPTKIITIDGGGMRGLYTLELMKAVQNRLTGSLSENTHVIAGTSTGSIIGFGLSRGTPLDTLINFYQQHGREIFYQTTWEYIEEGNGWLGPKYDPSKFERLLKENFGETKISEITKHHIMTFATNITKQKIKIFDSKIAQKNPKKDAPIWFTIRSSTAAPTYFPPTESNGDALCDGGIIANNPSFHTLSQLIHIYGWDNICRMKMVSFGTGTFPTGITFEYARKMGTLQWAQPISDMIIKSSSRDSNKWVKRLLSPNQFVRLDGKLEKDIPLDGYSEENIKTIREAALTYIKDNPESIDRAAKLLQ